MSSKSVSSSEPVEAAAALPYTRAIRWLGAGGGILAVVCVICGVVMLLMKWAGAHPPALMSQIPLILIPVAFLALIVSIVLAVLRRRAS